MAQVQYWYAVTKKTGGTCKCVSRFISSKMTAFMITVAGNLVQAQFDQQVNCQAFLDQQPCDQGGKKLLVKRRVGCKCMKTVKNQKNLIRACVTAKECDTAKKNGCV